MDTKAIEKELNIIRKEINQLNNYLALFLWKVFGNSEPDELENFRDIKKTLYNNEPEEIKIKDPYKNYLG